MLEDWRFADSPYVESGGLRAYAGAPLRLQDESGQTACLGSICVASPTRQAPLTRAQQTTLARLADWIVSDLVQLTRARRQRARRRMVDLIATAQVETASAVSEEPVMRILRTVYPNASVSLQSSKAGRIEAEGCGPVPLSDLSNGLWEDVDYIDRFIVESNHQELPTDRVVRIIAAQCESVAGQAFLAVGTKDFRLVFDDIDAWFVQTCAGIISEMWRKRLLTEVMLAKEKFLRGFSHQLRTPIHGILGSVELLTEELKSKNLKHSASQAMALLQATSATKSGGEHEMYLDTIKRAGQDLISIINSMITLNRWADVAATNRHYATYTIYELETELANETMKAISDDARYNASLFFIYDLPPDQCSIRTEMGLLRDSLLPLIINAVQNTPKGNVVVTMSVCSDTRELIVDIKDTGRGIPAKDHKRILELYEQVDTYSSGAGIGLTLASKFAALLQGSVELVSSEINRGSHFRATFRDVDLTYSKVPLLAEPAIPQLLNLPNRFHSIPSNPRAVSLCDHFARFLTCHGLSPSSSIEDALVILEFESDRKQHNAALSRLSPHQIAICLVPFPSGETHLDSTSKNVVYVHRPFLTSTMSFALQQAEKLLTSSKSNRSDPTMSSVSEGLVIHLETAVTTNQEGPARSDNETDHFSVKDGVQPGTIEAESAASAPKEPTYKQNVKDEHPSLETSRQPIVPLPSESAELPVRLAEDTLAGAQSISPAFASPSQRQSQSINSQSSQPILNLPPPVITSHPFALLVDDNTVNLRIMQMYCSKRSIRYLSARDGLEAVAIFQAHQSSHTASSDTPPISLIFMDLQMPNCDGIEATRRIRHLEKENGWQESVLFVVTGQDSAADRKAVEEVGGQEIYVKPVSIKTLDMGLKQYFPEFKGRR